MPEMPRYLTGPGDPDTALDVLIAAGWRCESDDAGNVAMFSPDGLARVGFLPESAICHYDGHLWVIQVHATPDAPEPEWTATFGEHTPADLVAAFLRAMTAPPAGAEQPALSPPTVPGERA